MPDLSQLFNQSGWVYLAVFAAVYFFWPKLAPILGPILAHINVKVPATPKPPSTLPMDWVSLLKWLKDNLSEEQQVQLAMSLAPSMPLVQATAPPPLKLERQADGNYKLVTPEVIQGA